MGGLQSREFCKGEQCQEFIKKTTKESCIVMFVKDTCPFCVRVKKIFDQLAIPYCAVSLTDRVNAKEIQETLGQMTGASTVPRVFINGNSVGGGDDVERLMKEGKLMKLINECAPGLLRSTCTSPGGGDGHRKRAKA